MAAGAGGDAAGTERMSVLWPLMLCSLQLCAPLFSRL